MNGLDNLEARRHVNRLCLAAETPLIESGTAGYLGQVRFCYTKYSWVEGLGFTWDLPAINSLLGRSCSCMHDVES